MRYLILFCIGLLFAPAACFAKDNAALQIKALMEYCVPAIKKDMDPAEYAAQKKLLELPADQAAKFSPDGGRVFMIPANGGNAALMTSKSHKGICSIAIHTTQAESFWDAVERTFNAKSAFKLQREKRLEAQKVTKRDYEADINGPVTLLITASDVPRPGAMQALMTIARHK